ncbi:unnamed protein product, partial [Timema podura]|nr:unnamed protein product [Timema podura]
MTFPTWLKREKGSFNSNTSRESFHNQVCLILVLLKNKPRLFLPWLLVYTGSFLFYLGVLCAAALSLQGDGEVSTSVEVFLRGLISCVLNVYFLLLCFCILPRVDSPTVLNKDPQRSYYDDMLAAKNAIINTPALDSSLGLPNTGKPVRHESDALDHVSTDAVSEKVHSPHYETIPSMSETVHSPHYETI